VIIELRATDRLRGPKAIDVAPVLTAIVQTALDGAVDPARLRVVCDWVQYRQNFRPPVDLRTIRASAVETARAGRDGLVGPGEAYELAIDLRRSGAGDLTAELSDALADRETAGCRSARPRQRVYLEPSGPGTASCIWAFNAMFWKELALWEQATGRSYEQALPSGQSDARNTEATRELIQRLFALWDDLAARRALPEELHVLELGVGNGNQARVWMDEFRRLDQELGRDYYRRLHYLMGDYSPRVLELARANVGDHAERLSCLILDATRPTETLGFLRYKAFLVYISNVYDNLPTDEIVQLGGQLFRVEVRAYLPGAAAERIATDLGMAPDELPSMVARLLRLGPELLSEALPQRFPTPLIAAAFWRAVWEALRLEESYAPFEELDAYEVAPGVSGEILRPILAAAGDARAHVSNGAVASFADTLPLLHPMGMLLCHDLFVTDLHEYRTGFRGPGKYDGSVVNWVSGPILAAVAGRRGFDVAFAPFAHRPGSNVTTMTTSVRE
jgi:SAM-dependent methyltransferase